MIFGAATSNKLFLVVELDAVVVDRTHEIWLLPINTKRSVKQRIISGISRQHPYRFIRIGTNKFQLMLTPARNELDVLVKNEEIDGGREFYRVKNVYNGYTGSVISQLTLTCGIPEGSEEFEAALLLKDITGSPDSFVGIGFFCKGMKEFKDAVNGMIRTVNASHGKKTSKWVPGYRYDKTDRSVIYLGNFLSHRSSVSGFQFLDKDSMVQTNLVMDIPEIDCDKLSELLWFGITQPRIRLIEISKCELAANAGRYVKDDIGDGEGKVDFQDLLEKAMNVKEVNCINKVSLLAFIKDLHKFAERNPSVVEQIHDYIKGEAIRGIVRLYNEDCPGDHEISGTDPKRLDREVMLLTSFVMGSHILRDSSIAVEYYMDLLSQIGIDMRGMFRDLIRNYNEKEVVFGGFDNYLTYYKDYYYNNPTGKEFNLRECLECTYKTGGSICDISLVEESKDSKARGLDVFGGILAKDTPAPNLKHAIIELIKGAINNPERVRISRAEYVDDVWHIRNRKKNEDPLGKYNITVTLDDLIENYHPVVSNYTEIPDELREEILRNKFDRISVTVINAKREVEE